MAACARSATVSSCAERASRRARPRSRRSAAIAWRSDSAEGPVVDRLVGVHEVAVADRHLAQRLGAVELGVFVELVERRRLPRGAVDALQAALLDDPEQALA